MDTDQRYLQHEQGANRDDGCTAITAVLVGQKLVIANVGDSRAVLSRQGKGVLHGLLEIYSTLKTAPADSEACSACQTYIDARLTIQAKLLGPAAMALSEDHKPNRTDERKRIENAGGVVVWAGTWRVGGVLAVSRAFGDRLLKRYVVATPDIQEELLSWQDEVVILATDGLWDVISNQESITLIKDTMASPFSALVSVGPLCVYLAAGQSVNGWAAQDAEKAAKKLTDEAYARGSNDNISCVVLRFKF